jgi:hypothetical protein
MWYARALLGALRSGEARATVKETRRRCWPTGRGLTGPRPKDSLLEAIARFRRRLRRSRARKGTGGTGRLDVCLECGEAFVYPVTWGESGPADWWLHLRCGSCGARRDVVVSNHAVALFDHALDEAAATMRRSADRLSRESLAEEAETLGAALRLDLLSADDFR